ncbi:hypothetical protein BP6252_07309 [Coleophoma cylindrospora]|uniref:Major facilitator superfamily (MFS) profile domain-containing protein n=1 Tax=Coleophoma cylindrospora TaxID=1849047 RepID=A0A3D8RH71_9HELO|nr:hypothetical protein BP6252_07309 [Coleophoma cylindrospora]
MLVAGRVGDIWGYKRVFLVGWIWSGFWALLAGISAYTHSMIFFDICRAFQGIGSAIIVPISLAIIGSVYNEGHRKNLAFSLYAAGAPIGFTLGAVISALLAQFARWEWAYYLTTIVCCLMAAMSYLVVPDLELESRQDEPRRDRTAKTFDWIGAFTGVSGLVLINLAWNRAPAVGWGSAQAIAPLVVGIVLFTLFFFVEKRVKRPLVPINQISTDAAWVLFVTAVGWSSFGILIYYLISFITQVQEDSLINAAGKLAPVPFSGVAAAILASVLLKKGLRTAWLLAIALVWFVIGNALLATTPVHQTYWKQIFWAVLITPLGIDMSFPAATIMISNLVSKEHQGVAASLVATVIYYSQSIGLGIAGTVEVYVRDGDLLRGFRAALYSAVGLSGLGLLIACGYAASASKHLHRWSGKLKDPTVVDCPDGGGVLEIEMGTISDRPTR